MHGDEICTATGVLSKIKASLFNTFTKSPTADMPSKVS